jgi:hypothetical protein
MPDYAIINHVQNLRFIDITCFAVITVYHFFGGFALFFLPDSKLQLAPIMRVVRLCRVFGVSFWGNSKGMKRHIMKYA